MCIRDSSGTDTDAQKEAACVLAHAYRIAGDTNRFFQMTLRDMLSTPCAEICLELGAYLDVYKRQATDTSLLLHLQNKYGFFFHTCSYPGQSI